MIKSVEIAQKNDPLNFIAINGNKITTFLMKKAMRAIIFLYHTFMYQSLNFSVFLIFQSLTV